MHSQIWKKEERHRPPSCCWGHCVSSPQPGGKRQIEYPKAQDSWVLQVGAKAVGAWPLVSATPKVSSSSGSPDSSPSLSVGHFKGFPRSSLKSAQSQHLQPSHWSPKYPISYIHPFLLKRPGIKPWLSCLQCVLLHLQLVLSKPVMFYVVPFSWTATSSCTPCHTLLVNFHNTTNEIHIITPILQWGGLSIFTQLTIELGIHSAILPPSKSFRREYRTNIQMRER